MSHPPSSVVAELADLRGRANALTNTLWAARTPDELMDTFAEAEALKATLDALELGVVRELEATGAVKGAGWASTQDYVTHTAGGHKGTGPAMVRLAAAVAEPVLSPVGSALADGWLSVAKAHVIERAIDRLPGDPEVRARGVQVLLAEAKSLDATELRKVALHLASLVDPEGDARRDEKALDRLERAAHLERHLTITDDQAGGAWIKGRCTSEAAALIKATLIPLAAPQPNTGPVCDPHTCREPGCSHTGRDPRDHGARMLDALLDACRLLQTAEVLPESHGTLPRLTITIDYTQLLTLSGLGEAETGERLSASAIRQLCCDAEIIPIVMAGTSQVLDVGRQMRLASAAIWKALVARDKHCRFKNCQRPPVMCHAHHLTHWINGGPTALDNMVLLCGHHHRLIHAEPWEIRATAPSAYEFIPPKWTARHETGPAPPDG
jgi:hypothetical protein